MPEKWARALLYTDFKMRHFYYLHSLPFNNSDISPFISKKTIYYHHQKHHRAYVNKVNEILNESSQRQQSLSINALIKNSKGNLFNQASQMWSHTFFWHSLCSKTKSQVGKKLMNNYIKASFGNWYKMKNQFVTAGLSHFGSGWLWLIKKSKSDNSLEWIAKHDADSPLKSAGLPLLTCDLWEHSYYLDYQYNRKTYLKKAIPFLNWSFAAATIERKAVPNFENDCIY